MKNNDLFKTDNSIASKYIKKYEYPYEVLPNIKNIVLEIGQNLDSNYKLIGDNIWVSKTVNVPNNATIIGPCIIDHNTEIRPNAFIRENVIIGKNCVIGNSCEFKNCILYDNVKVPHFNYVGDSILGYSSHMGAGSIISNVKSDNKNIIIKSKINIETNLRKVGAFIGDNVEIGCNAVLNPGTIIGSNTTIYPLTMVRGIIDSNMIVKSQDNIVKRND